MAVAMILCETLGDQTALCIYILPRWAAAQDYHFFEMYFQTGEKRAQLWLKMVIGGKLFIMNCAVNKLVDSELNIFLILSRISNSVD